MPLFQWIFSMNFFSLPSILHCSAFCATCFAEFSLTTFWQFMRHHNKNAVAAWVAKRGKGKPKNYFAHTNTHVYENKYVNEMKWNSEARCSLFIEGANERASAEGKMQSLRANFRQCLCIETRPLGRWLSKHGKQQQRKVEQFSGTFCHHSLFYNKI